MALVRIGTAVGAAWGAARHNARLRRAETSDERRRRHRSGRRTHRPSWVQRLDATVDPAIAFVAILMLVALLREWR
jgi:hypothetical protein